MRGHPQNLGLGLQEESTLEPHKPRDSCVLQVARRDRSQGWIERPKKTRRKRHHNVTSRGHGKMTRKEKTTRRKATERRAPRQRRNSGPANADFPSVVLDLKGSRGKERKKGEKKDRRNTRCCSWTGHSLLQTRSLHLGYAGRSRKWARWQEMVAGPDRVVSWRS